MRLELKWILIVNSALVVYILYQLRDLVVLVDDSPRQYKILEPELVPTTENTTYPHRDQLIPKIIHQTYKDNNIPPTWDKVRQTCKYWNPEYKHMFWTDTTAREFIQLNYPWFLKTYDSYKFPIQRADSFRYFVLAKMGGIYIDLDCGCERNLDTMLTFPAFLRKTDPVGISNDVMGSVPGHPFFLKVLEELENYNKNWLISYLTVMYTTGPLFLSVIMKKYQKMGSRPGWGDVRILYPGNKKLHTWKYFFDSPGSSWHAGDAKFLIFLGDHIFFAIFMGTLLVLGLLYLQFRLYTRLATVGVRRYRLRAQRYVESTVRRLLNRPPLSPSHDQLMQEFHENRHTV